MEERQRGPDVAIIIGAIVIIALGAAPVTGMFARLFLGARVNAAAAGAKTTMSNLRVALKAYQADVDNYPGHDVPVGQDASWVIYDALCPRGKNAPHYDFRDSEVLVEDGGIFRVATEEERADPEVRKFIADPWGMPFRYRENDSRAEKTPQMHNRHEFDMYSFGPDRKDDGGGGDDITNWGP